MTSSNTGTLTTHTPPQLTRNGACLLNTSIARSGSRRFDKQLSRQTSHPSITDNDARDGHGHVEVAKLKEEELNKMQQDRDKNIPEVKMTMVIALNAKEC